LINTPNAKASRVQAFSLKQRRRRWLRKSPMGNRGSHMGCVIAG
jgi:hypothetical protein